MERLVVSAETRAGEEEDDGWAAGSSGCCCLRANAGPVESRRRFCDLGFTSSAIATCALTGRGSAFLVNRAPEVSKARQAAAAARCQWVLGFWRRDGGCLPWFIRDGAGWPARRTFGVHFRAPFGTRSEGRAPGAKRDGSGETGTCHHFSCLV